jgi:hypothetical protein
MEPDGRFGVAVARFEELSGEDPSREWFDGEELASEVVYARRMSGWLERLVPEAPEPLRLAVRCQHLRRWEIPRARYPVGRAGYLSWRNDCTVAHARLAATVLRQVGYDETTIQRVEDLVQKKRLKLDRDAQALEDAACLVFLESTLSAFAPRHDENKVTDILRKTWRKMSKSGQQCALALALEAPHRQLLERAISETYQV